MVPIHSRHRLEPAIQAADEALDRAWATGADVEAHLMVAKRLSEEIGRDPAIEDAKVLLARANGCTPSEAFDLLRQISQHTNRKLRDVAHDIVDKGVDAGAGSHTNLAARDKRRRGSALNPAHYLCAYTTRPRKRKEARRPEPWTPRLVMA